MSESFPINADGTPDADHEDERNGDRRPPIYPSIFLDYGADGASGEDAACEVCTRGMRFRSRWQFEMNTVLQIAFHDGTADRFETEGIVVECSPDGEGRHLTTLAFVEVPKDLCAALGKVSARLVFPS